VLRTAVCVEACIVAFAESKVIPHILERITFVRKDLESLDVTAQMEEFVHFQFASLGYIADTGCFE
jgi:hypothetical protein